ncbi:MAG: hypothetical protein ABIG93_00285 [archaeon]|nr:hypothetical protein [Nanoarchaeota archaeon]
MADKDKDEQSALTACLAMYIIGGFLIGGSFVCNSPEGDLEQRLGDVPEQHEDAGDYGVDSGAEYDADGDCYSN